MTLEKVLVTGGGGFIGSHLVDELVKLGAKVTVLDNFETGKIENLSGCLGRIRLVIGDVRSQSSLKVSLRDVDTVFHLAAITSVPFSIEHPKVTDEVNFEGTMHLLEGCIRHKVERFILASSSAVYGEPKYLPIDEGHPLNPISPYAESKVKAEEVCMRFREDYGLKTTILRPFNVYGPRQRNDQYAGVIEKFIEYLRGAKPLVIYGDGSQTRDFIYVADAVNAFILASKSDRAVGEIFNIATGQPTSINSLAQLMIDISGVKGVVLQHADAREGDIKHSYANIEMARSLLLFEPKVQLKEGLSKLLRLKGLSKV